MSYFRFAAMIATSTVVMFGLMYLNTFTWTHVFFSETRAYMAVLMGAVMAIIMLGFMLGMYSNKALNMVIFAGAAIVFAASLWLVRSQVTVGDVSYMRAMIPHHSIAIMTSGRAKIEDPRVRKLADEIIAAQQKEIAEMRYLIGDLTGDDVIERPATMDEKPAEVAPVNEAISSAVLATLDPADLKPEDIQKVLGDVAGEGCRFKRTVNSEPILATSASEGVMKLSGQLVELGASPAAGPEGAALSADGLEVRVTPVDGNDNAADLFFALDKGLTVGYRGTWSCAG